MGDFNDVFSNSEKDGLRGIEPIRLNLFISFIDDSKLIDTELQGCKFTWLSNPRDGFVTRELIDRVLANWARRELFRHALTLALPIVNSDHAPILLKPKPPLTSGRSFKFEAFWNDHEDCKGIVANGWVGHHSEPWNQWDKRVEACKSSLIKWQRSTFRNAAKDANLLSRVFSTKTRH